MITDKLTELERAVVDAAMAFANKYPGGMSSNLAMACDALSEARAALEPVPGEMQAWRTLFPGSRGFADQSPNMLKDFRAALRIAIEADREARNG